MNVNSKYPIIVDNDDPEESKDKRGDKVEIDTRSVNYFSIHGTIPGGGVDAKSSLAHEVT